MSTTLNAPPAALTWRTFDSITSASEAAFVSARCEFSLCTVEMGSTDGVATLALVERELPEVWRWALISPEGPVVAEGRASDRDDAKRHAVEAMSLVKA